MTDRPKPGIGELHTLLVTKFELTDSQLDDHEARLRELERSAVAASTQNDGRDEKIKALQNIWDKMLWIVIGAILSGIVALLFKVSALNGVSRHAAPPSPSAVESRSTQPEAREPMPPDR